MTADDARQLWLNLRQALLMAVSAIERYALKKEITTSDACWWLDLEGHRQKEARRFILEKRHTN